MQPVLLNLAGILVILLIALALSRARRRIRLRVVGAAFALQALLALLILRTPWGRTIIQAMAMRWQRCSPMPTRARPSCSARRRTTRWRTPSPSERCR